MDNNVCKIGPFLPFQGCVTYSNIQHHEQQCKRDNSNNKIIASATLFQGVHRFLRRCIQSETSLRPKLPSVSSPSICDSLATTIPPSSHRGGSEDSGGGLAQPRAAERARRERREESRTVLTRAWLGDLDWAGWGRGSPLRRCWCGVAVSPAGDRSPIPTCTRRTEQREVRVRVAHNPSRMSWLQGQMVWCHSCLL